MSSKFLNLAKNLAQKKPVGKIPFLPSFSKKTEPPYDFPIQIGDPRLREICEEANIMHYQDRSFLEDELAVKTVKNLLKGNKNQKQINLISANFINSKF